MEEEKLRTIELRTRTKKKRGRKTLIAVYEYLADCDGKWGEFSYCIEDDTVEIRQLADWDTTVSHRFGSEK